MVSQVVPALTAGENADLVRDWNLDKWAHFPEELHNLEENANYFYGIRCMLLVGITVLLYDHALTVSYSYMCTIFKSISPALPSSNMRYISTNYKKGQMYQGLISGLKVAHVWRGKFGVVPVIFLVVRPVRFVSCEG